MPEGPNETIQSLTVQPANGENLVVVGETNPALAAVEEALRKQAENEELTKEEEIIADTAEIIAGMALSNNQENSNDKKEGAEHMEPGIPNSNEKTDNNSFVAGSKSFIFDGKPLTVGQPANEAVVQPSEITPEPVEQANKKTLSEMNISELNGQLVEAFKIDNANARQARETEIFQAMASANETSSTTTPETANNVDQAVDEAMPEEQTHSAEINEPETKEPSLETDKGKGPKTVKIFVGMDKDGNNIYEDFPYGTNPEQNSTISYKNMTLDELTTEWANAMDNKNDDASRDINAEIRGRLRENNISGNDKPFEEYNHQDALMSRIYEAAEAKRKKQEEIDNTDQAIEAEPSNEDSDKETEPVIEKVKDTHDEEFELEPWQIQAARSVDLTETLLTMAMKINAEKQEAAKLKNSHNIIKAISSRVKNLTIFKANVETLQAKNLLDMCREKSTNGNLTFEDWKEVLKANNIEPIPEQEAAFLGILASNMEGLIQNQVDAPEEIKDAIKTSCANFAGALAGSGHTPEDIENLKATHKAEISEIFKSNPNSNPRDLELYADNATEILNNILAVLEHEKGMDAIDKQLIDKQLAEMKVSLGEVQYGPNNNIDTTMLEKVDRLGKLHNAAGAVTKGATIVGAWIISGGATALAIQSSKSGATMASSAAIGSLIAGPLGTVVGIGVGAIGAGLYARHLGRRRENEQAERYSSDVRETKIGFNRKGRKLIQQFLDKDGNIRSDLEPKQIAKVEAIKENYSKKTKAEILKPRQISMQDQISSLMRYHTPKDGLSADFNKSNPLNYELRANLSKEERTAASTEYQRLHEMIVFSQEYNETASGVASKAHSRSGIRKSLSSTLDTEGLALNLFEATTQESYLPEMFAMMSLLGNIETAMGTEEFQSLTVQTQNADGKIIVTPITETLQAVASGVREDCEWNVADYWDSVRKDVNRVGRKGFAIGSTVALVAGLATKGSGILRDARSGDTIASPTVKDVPVLKNTNGSYSVDTPAGTHTFNLDPVTGKMQQTDLELLDSLGMNIEQKVTPANAVESVTDYIKNKLGGEKADIQWIAKTSTPTGTELSLHQEMLPNGDYQFWSQGGIASNGAESFDILNSDCVLRLSDTSDTTAIIGTFQRVGDRLVTTLRAGDPAIAALKSADVGMSIVKDGVHKSIATIPNPDGSVVSTVLNTEIGAKLTQAGAAIAKKVSGWFVGPVTTATDSGEGGIKDGTARQSAGLQTEGEGQIPETPKPASQTTSALPKPPIPTAATGDATPLTQPTTDTAADSTITTNDSSEMTTPVSAQPEFSASNTPETSSQENSLDINTDQGYYNFLMDAARLSEPYAPSEAMRHRAAAQKVIEKNPSVIPIGDESIIDTVEFEKIMNEKNSPEAKEKIAQEAALLFGNNESQREREEVSNQADTKEKDFDERRKKILNDFDELATSPKKAESQETASIQVDPEKELFDKRRKDIQDGFNDLIKETREQTETNPTSVTIDSTNETEAPKQSVTERVDGFAQREKTEREERLAMVRRASLENRLADIKTEDLYAYLKILIPGSAEEQKVRQTITRRNSNYVNVKPNQDPARRF